MASLHICKLLTYIFLLLLKYFQCQFLFILTYVYSQPNLVEKHGYVGSKSKCKMALELCDYLYLSYCFATCHNSIQWQRTLFNTLFTGNSICCLAVSGYCHVAIVLFLTVNVIPLFHTDKIENGDVHQRKRGAHVGPSEGQEMGSRQQEAVGRPGSSWRRILLLILAITIHNIPGESEPLGLCVASDFDSEVGMKSDKKPLLVYRCCSERKLLHMSRVCKCSELNSILSQLCLCQHQQLWISG